MNNFLPGSLFGPKSRGGAVAGFDGRQPTGRRSAALAMVVAIGGALQAAGQYPGHTQNGQQQRAVEPRAVSVLEWVGEAGKPVASRMVPVSVFVGGEYQDGGLYLAQPAPLSVQTDTLYELEKAGVPQGTFYIADGSDVGGSWFGYGKWKALPPPPPVKKLTPSKVAPTVVQDKDPDRPHFKGGDPSGAPPPAAGSTASSETTPAHDDPDKPVLHRRSDSTDSSDAGTTAAPAAEDPDRPHLKKHSAASDASAPVEEGSSVSSVNERDPDRPRMMRGKPAMSEKELEATKLTGMPADLQQMTAVSDPAAREEHPFTYQWAQPGDSAKMQAALEAIAMQAVVAPVGAPIGKPSAVPPLAASRTGAPRSTLARRVAGKPPPVTLTEKQFHAFELSYSGGATLVFSAKALIGPNNGGVTLDRYVTIVAQPDFDGVPQVRLQSVTDLQHLDITPRMKLVDAVDTRGDNQAELIFELRRANDRRFAIYRVRGTHAEQTFATAPLPVSAPNHAETDLN